MKNRRELLKHQRQARLLDARSRRALLRASSRGSSLTGRREEPAGERVVPMAA